MNQSRRRMLIANRVGYVSAVFIITTLSACCIIPASRVYTGVLVVLLTTAHIRIFSTSLKSLYLCQC
jgi:hypothetical protein